MASYAVGDIQGCYDCLRRLLDAVAFDPARDRLWSVGDLVNRGPRSLDTLRFLKSLGPAFTAVLGNHDLHLLALAAGCCPGGKRESLQEVLDAPDCEELCEWLRAWPLSYREQVESDAGLQEVFMVHAGFLPNWSTERAAALGAEVEAALGAPDYRAFLAAMYGDEPEHWDEQLSGMARLRVITNVLTRLRVCTRAGRMDLSMKRRPEDAAPGYRPWFQFQDPAPGQLILFGHWAALDGVTGHPRLLALDTGCVWGRRLSLLRLEDRKLFSVPCG